MYVCMYVCMYVTKNIMLISKPIKLLKGKISKRLRNWNYTNSMKMANNKRPLAIICFANWNRPWCKQTG